MCPQTFVYLYTLLAPLELNINHQNKYLFIHRPHLPITKLNVSESYDTYMSRSYKVTKDILADCKNKGECQIGPLFFFKQFFVVLQVSALWPCVPFDRKQHSHCGPCFIFRGLHPPAPRPHPTQRQRVCSSCQEGNVLFFLLLFKILSVGFAKLKKNIFNLSLGIDFFGKWPMVHNMPTQFHRKYLV